MPALDELLATVIPSTVDEIDYEALARRGTRRRRAKRAGFVLVALALVAGVVPGLFGRDMRVEITPVGPESIGGWQPMSPSPLGPRAETQTSVDGARILIWGGEGPPEEGFFSGMRRQDGAVYDVDTDTWTMISQPPGEPIDMARTWLVGDRVVLLGGHAVNGSTEVTGGSTYDLRSESWATLPDAPLDVNSAHIFRHGDRLVVLDVNGRTAVLDVSLRAWTALPRLPGRVGWFGTAFGDGQLFVFGGSVSQKRPLRPVDLVADGWLLDVDEATWEHVPAGPLSARTSPRTSWLDGRFLVWEGDGEDVDGWEPTSTATDLEPEESCSDGECFVSLGAILEFTPGAPPVQRTDGAWFDPQDGSWTPFEPAGHVGADFKEVEDMHVQGIGPTTLLISARLPDGQRTWLADVATGQHWDLEGGLVYDLELSGGEYVGLPYLSGLGVLERGEPTHITVLREVDPGRMLALESSLPEVWDGMRAAVIDGRVIAWSGYRLGVDPDGRYEVPATWLDGGWILDVRHPQ